MTTTPTGETSGSRGLWVGLALGAPIMAFGVVGAFGDRALTHPAELARWIVGLALVHDLLLVPLVLAVGWLARRVVPARDWAAVRWALVASAVLVLFAWPFVRGYGRTPSVPSLLARDYGAGLLWYLGAVWAVAGVVIVAGRIGQRRRKANPQGA